MVKSSRFAGRSVLPFNTYIEGRLGVSPYAIFLQSLTGSNALKGRGFEERGHKCAHLWYNSESAAKAIIRQKAAVTPVFPQRKYQSPRKPPPFARWVRLNWHLAPLNLTFEEKTVFLAEKYAAAQRRSGRRSVPYVAKS